MKSFEHAWQAVDKLLWGLGLVFGVLLPVLTYRLPILTRVLWIELILLLVNGVFSIWIGRYIKRHQLRWATLLIFPLLFLIAAYFFMPKFAYYFAPAYWAISYLSWADWQQK